VIFGQIEGQNSLFLIKKGIFFVWANESIPHCNFLEKQVKPAGIFL
jgi:hypothetical protein